MLEWKYLNNLPTKMTENQEMLVHHLPNLLLIAGIGYLCEESVEEFLHRSKKLQMLAQTKAEDLEPFYGLRVNVITEDSIEWAKKHFVRRSYSSLKPKVIANKPWVKKIANLAFSKESNKKANNLVLEEA